MTIDQLKDQQAELDARHQEVINQHRIETDKAQKALNDISKEWNKIQGVIEYLEKQAK